MLNGQVRLYAYCSPATISFHLWISTATVTYEIQSLCHEFRSVMFDVWSGVSGL